MHIAALLSAHICVAMAGLHAAFSITHANSRMIPPLDSALASAVLRRHRLRGSVFQIQPLGLFLACDDFDHVHTFLHSNHTLLRCQWSANQGFEAKVVCFADLMFWHRQEFMFDLIADLDNRGDRMAWDAANFDLNSSE